VTQCESIFGERMFTRTIHRRERVIWPLSVDFKKNHLLRYGWKLFCVQHGC